MIRAKLVDIRKRSIYPVEMTVANGQIERIEPIDLTPDAPFLLPGFVDAHIHIESSMLPPSEFARLALVHGTVATVSDPHEIANVLGVDGVHFMLDDARRVPLKFCFGAPSCVPATTFETAGAAIDAEAVKQLLAHDEIGYLSEMMNFPGVLMQDEEVMAKLAAAKAIGKPIDGHAPGLRGEDAKRYFAEGITTDHECFSYEEGREKALLGVKILIREGSAARNFEALWPLIQEFPSQIMFCSDDKHPDDLIQGHINQLVARAVAKGCDLFDVLYAACIHPVEHYKLSVGTLQIGDPADFVLVSDLENFQVRETWIDGDCVAKEGRSLLKRLPVACPNQCSAQAKTPNQFEVPISADVSNIQVIEVFDGEIVTGNKQMSAKVDSGLLQADVDRDLLKITVVNRYTADAPPAVGFVFGTGLKKGALASSVAHDSHNIVAVGVDDESLCRAVNAVIESGGGISAVDDKNEVHVLPLPIAGLMSDQDGYELAGSYTKIDRWVKDELRCPLRAPFMTLSFLALPVIPSLKMTDLGLFDVEQFSFTDIIIKNS